jgi:hypothetical protein
MKNRILLGAAALVLVAVPAVVGLWGNASFAGSVPVPVPASGEVVTPAPSTAPTPSTAPSPSDDRGGEKPRDDRVEPGDDRDGDRDGGGSTSGGDDRGHDDRSSDDRSGDDGGHHGGDD